MAPQNALSRSQHYKLLSVTFCWIGWVAASSAEGSGVLGLAEAMECLEEHLQLFQQQQLTGYTGMVATNAQHLCAPLKSTDNPIYISCVQKWGLICIVTLCLMGLLRIKCTHSSILTPTEKHIAYECADTLLSQVYPDSPPAQFLSSLFLTVSVNHSAACHNLFLQHTGRCNRERTNMPGRSHLKQPVFLIVKLKLPF